MQYFVVCMRSRRPSFIRQYGYGAYKLFLLDKINFFYYNFVLLEPRLFHFFH